MHPAYSVILFTTASGAGYGLLALAGLAGASHGPASTFAFGATVMLIGLGLVSLGLLSSTLHLGHPERAWRAFSQWRSSWLSREGVAAIITFVPALAFGAVWLNPEGSPALIRAFGYAMAAMCVVTVVTTGMIYASLPTIRQWRNPLTVPVYLAFAAATGSCLLLAIAAWFGRGAVVLSYMTIGAILLAMLIKGLYWRSIDSAPKTLTAAMATGLPGPVRQWERPHTSENFVMKEMGYTVARRHARKLRSVVFVALATALVFAIPAMGGMSTVAAVSASLGAIAALIGAVVERWLFFAEAQHVVTLYYGAERA
ncbi:MAG: DmsC/YnfH family molybdoenzyme membrane anchor subunit [Hyphomicrobiales bacterium]